MVMAMYTFIFFVTAIVIYTMLMTLWDSMMLRRHHLRMARAQDIRLRVANEYHPTVARDGISPEYNAVLRHVLPRYARAQDRLRYLQFETR